VPALLDVSNPFPEELRANAANLLPSDEDVIDIQPLLAGAPACSVQFVPELIEV
jgi:hypothetical protein